ncbi:unnamed protein product [Ectocarpus sp. 12 AP-2014]
MRTKIAHKDGGGKQQRREALPEVRAGLVLVKSKDVGRSRRPHRTWVLPVLRVLALAASMLCLTPTGGMVTGMSKMDAWSADSEPEQQHEDRRPTGVWGQRQEHVVFVGVPEESAVLPLKALAQEMIGRGYRASLALPHGFQAWVEDIPGLSFLSLKPTGGAPNSNATTHSHGPPATAPQHHLAAAAEGETATTDAKEQQQHQHQQQHAPSPHFARPCPARPPPANGRRRPCSGEGLGDAWGGGVGGGWGAGLGIWRGVRGSLVGARDFFGHLKTYLGFYLRQEEVMYAPLLEALRRDPPALVIADRRASAAFRACSRLGLRCVVNSAGLLGDLDRPPNSIPAPYTGFPLEGQTIGQRVHSSLFRLVLALSRMQASLAAAPPAAAREADDDLASWADDRPVLGSEEGPHHHHHQDHHHHHHHHHQQDPRSSTVMALGNSCFGSLEYPRELPSRVHMVGPLWMSSWTVDDQNHLNGGHRSESHFATGHHGDTGAGSPANSKKGKDDDGGAKAGGGAAPARKGFARDAAVTEGGDGAARGNEALEDVWSWLEPEGVEEDDAAPVVVVQLGYGGGWAWGVSPDAAVGGSEGEDGSGARPSWKAFREETATQLSAVGCRTLWLDHGPHPDHHREPTEEQDETATDEAENGSGDHSAERSALGRSSLWKRSKEGSEPPKTTPLPSTAGGKEEDAELLAAGGGNRRTGPPHGGWELLDGRQSLLFFDAGGLVVSSEWLLRIMSHRLVTVLVTDGDVRSLQTALWHGKPSVVLPTSPDQREAAARLAHSGAGVTCPPPCNATSLTAAVVDAHGADMRRGALRSSAALHEAGGVGRAGDLLENELRTHLAATARRLGCPHGDPSLWWGFDDDRDGDVPSWCYRRRREDEEGFSKDDWFSWELGAEERFPPSEGYVSEGLSWFPDDPEWVWREMSWLQRHLVDVYAVYGALVMGVGLLMKLTWNLVW